MNARTSVRAMLLQMAGLADTGALTPWENEFLKNALRTSEQGNRTSALTAAQVEKVQEIYGRHIAS